MSAELEAKRAELEQAWPGVRVRWEEFVRTIAGRNVRLDELRLADLYLCSALLERDRAALQIFEDQLIPKIERSIRRVDPSPAFVDEVTQLLRERLLVGKEGEPGKLAQYAGRGAFDRWLSLSASRIALNLKRSVRRERELEDDALGAMVADQDPELEAIWEGIRAKYQQALRRSLEGLTARERTLLKQHYLDRLQLDELGAIHHVHRTTAFRWLQRAQANLREGTLDALRGMGIDASTIRSVERAAHSRFTLSISRILRES